MMKVSEEQRRAQAEEVLAAYLAENELEDERGFRRLCSRNRDLAGDLRRLRHEFGVLQTAIDDAAVEEDLDTAVADRLAGLKAERAQHEQDARAAEVEETKKLLGRLTAARSRSDRFELRGEVARGGMGVILRAWDSDLRRTLAMKVLPDGVDTKRDEEPQRPLTRFLEEAQVTGQLEHPGIVPVHELGVDGKGCAFFTMPLVRGRDFKRVLELVATGEEGWTQTRALGVVIKVCEAMAYAHSKGVLHRDLKPANVMVGRFGEVYVMDWGLARVMGRPDSRDLRLRPVSDDPPSVVVATDRSIAKSQTPGSPLLTMDGDVVGTPSYMSPEQAEGRIEELGPRSEVYAIGAMLYQLLTGQMPYVTSGSRISARTVLGMLLQGPPPDVLEVVPDVDPELAAICRKAMRRRPLERYSNTQELARDIENFLGKRPIQARRGTLTYHARLAVQRNKGIALTAAAGVVALLVAATLFVLGLQRAADEEARARGQAEEALAVTERMLDVESADVLVREERELYPALPHRLPALEAWIRRVDALLARRDEYAVEAAVEPGSAELAGLLANLDQLALLLPRVTARRDFATTVVARTVDDHAAEWAQAADDVAADARFADFALEPVPGLVPLQRNPTTGLWEFWHVRTGERPAVADEKTGRLDLGSESGVVLILLPGGTFAMGSPEHELGRVEDIEALHDVALEPFFISKYELTQAQWKRVMDSNDSKLAMGRPVLGRVQMPRADQPVSGLHPVERVTWFECVEFGQRADLVLPTEGQWEYACRAGSATTWCWGEALEALEGRENLADAAALELSPLRPLLPWSDGYSMHAPVGSFAENAFGLFDVHGNVSEWCRDESVEDTGDRVFRGGSWYTNQPFARSAFRRSDHPKAGNPARGVRLSRRATP